LGSDADSVCVCADLSSVCASSPNIHAALH